MSTRPTKIVMIPIDDINILNPRVRNRKKFNDMAENIAKVGLKRPITVTRARPGNTHGRSYELVCGQGRIEACLAYDQSKIPAIIIDASEEEALVMSLVENLARKQHHVLDLLRNIQILCKHGYDGQTIAEKTGLSQEYTLAIISLLKRGEERLIAAVEAGQIPITVAVKIAESKGDEQRALQEAYENNELRGKKLLFAKQLIERRKKSKLIKSGGTRHGANQPKPEMSSGDVLRIYQKEVDRKRLLTRKADITARKLLFIKEAMKRLLQDDNFINLLRAENLATLPKQLTLMLGVRNEKL